MRVDSVMLALQQPRQERHLAPPERPFQLRLRQAIDLYQHQSRPGRRAFRNGQAQQARQPHAAAEPAPQPPPEGLNGSEHSELPSLHAPCRRASVFLFLRAAAAERGIAGPGHVLEQFPLGPDGAQQVFPRALLVLEPGGVCAP
jgi:hypothetical protein